MGSFLAFACTLPCLAGLRGGEPESKKPSAEAAKDTTFGWVSEVGLRFTWSLPEGYDGRSPRDLTVLLHGQGSSYLWGSEHHPPASFRPRDVLVSPEGTTEQADGSHVFLGRPADAEKFRALLAELRTAFAVQRVFVYGFEDGGAFALFFAGESPDEVAGVVAHGGGFLEWTIAPQPMRQLPIVLLHGTRDSVVPYSASVQARDKLVQRGLRAVRLRRLGGYGHGPNAVRAGEALAWCQGYASQSPAETLD